MSRCCSEPHSACAARADQTRVFSMHHASCQHTHTHIQHTHNKAQQETHNTLPPDSCTQRCPPQPTEAALKSYSGQRHTQCFPGHSLPQAQQQGHQVLPKAQLSLPSCGGSQAKKQSTSPCAVLKPKQAHVPASGQLSQPAAPCKPAQPHWGLATSVSTRHCCGNTAQPRPRSLRTCGGPDSSSSELKCC